MEKIQNENRSSRDQAKRALKRTVGQNKTMSNEKIQQSFMPFLFRRKFKRIDCQSSPAPGQYETKSNFQKKNERDILEQSFRVRLENSRKIKESVFFKSTAKRFSYNESITSQPKSMPVIVSQHKKAKTKPKSPAEQDQNSITSKAASISSKPRRCPSIPDKTNKFGYSVGNRGNMEKILKNQQDLTKEKEEMRKYVKNLRKEEKFRGSSFRFTQDKKMLLKKLREKASEFDYRNDRNYSQNNCRKQMKKPLRANNSQRNFSNIVRIIEEKRNVENNRGPGCYNAPNQIYPKLTPQKYQFFSSSAERFPKTSVSKKIDTEFMMKKAEVENKILDARKQKCDKLKKMLKHEKTCRRSDTESGLKQLPGPVYYDLRDNILNVQMPSINHHYNYDREKGYNLTMKCGSRIANSNMLKNSSNDKENLQHLVYRIKNQMIFRDSKSKSKSKNKEILRKSNIKKQLELKNKSLRSGNSNRDSEICSWEINTPNHTKKHAFI